jgi:cardiolipin synthase
VQVRLLLDAIGSAACTDAFLAPLVGAGGEVAWFHPTRIWRFWWRPWLNLRTHRKIAVIDSRVGYTGGINITDEQNERLRSDAYRDLHLRIEGDAVRALQRRTGSTPRATAHSSPKSPGRCLSRRLERFPPKS